MAYGSIAFRYPQRPNELNELNEPKKRYSPQRSNPMKFENERRVVVTGAGVISAIGETMPDFSSSLFDGVCGIKETNLFDTTGYTCRLGGADQQRKNE